MSSVVRSNDYEGEFGSGVLHASEDCRSLAPKSAMSRRAFFSLVPAVGALAFLGSACGGRILAFADEAGNTHFEVTVVSRKHIILVVTDVANGNKVIPNAKVVIRSLSNDQTVTGVSNDKGYVLLDIQALAEDPSDNADQYSFWGRVSVSVSGYREYECYRTFIVGGARDADETGVRPVNLQIPTQPFNEATDIAYVRTLAFNDDDMQYGPVTYPVCSGNDGTHTVIMQVMTSQGTSVEGWLTVDGEVVAGPMKKTATQHGGAEASSDAERATLAQGSGAVFAFQGQYLQSWPVGGTLRCHFKIGQTTWTVPTRLSLVEAMGGLTEPIYGFDQAISFLSGNFANNAKAEEDGHTTPEKDADWQLNPLSGQLTFPESWPILGGAELELGLPHIPFDFLFDPSGTLGISVNMDTINLRKDGKNFNKNDWKFMSVESVKEWRDGYKKDFDRALDRWNGAKAASKDATRQTSYPKLSEFRCKVQAGVYALANFDAEADKFSGEAGLMAELSLYGLIGKQFVVYGVPCFVTFDIESSTAATFAGGFTMEPFDFSTIQFTSPRSLSSHGNMVVSERLELGLTGGIGVYGYISASARFYGYVQATYALTNGDKEETAPYMYHDFSIGAGIGLQFLFQVLLFKGSQNIYSKDWPDVYHTSKRLSSGQGGSLGDVDPSTMKGMFFETMADLEMVSDEALLGMAEFAASTDDEGLLKGGLFLESGGTNTKAPIPEPDVVKSFALGADGTYERVYNPKYGTRPLGETKILSNVMSDPRCKVVTVDGVKYLCRLSVVSVDLEDGVETLAMASDKDELVFFKAVAADPTRLLADSDDLGEASAGFGLPAATWDEETQQWINPVYKSDCVVATIEVPEGGSGLAASRLFASQTSLEDRLAAVPMARSTTKVPRVRVTVAAFDRETSTWGTPQLVDFAIPLTAVDMLRANMHETDFDVVAEGGMLHFALTSAVRPVDEDKTFENQTNLQFTTYVAVAPEDDGIVVKSASTTVAELANGHVTWNAKIGVVTYDDSLGLGTIRLIGVVCIAKDKDDENYLEVRWYNAQTGALFRTCKYDKTSIDVLKYNPNVDVALANRPDADETRMLAAWFSPLDGSEGDDCATAVFDVNPRNSGAGSWKIPGCINPTPLPRNGGLTGFLYTKTEADIDGQKTLYRMNLGDFGELVTDQKMCSIESDKFFTSYDGLKLFTIRNMDERALGSTNDPVRRYQILAANAYGTYSYTSFYPFAQLVAPIDSLVNFENNGYSTSFVYTSITDFDNLKADVYHVEVPYVTALQLDDVTCVDDFYGPGDTCNILVTVSNTGNMRLIGFELDIYDNDAQEGLPLGHIQVPLQTLASAVQPSLDHYIPVLDENGEATGEYTYDADCIDESRIWPGKTRTYKLSFVLPETLSGEVTLYAFISKCYIGDRVSEEGLLMADETSSLALAQRSMLRGAQDEVGMAMFSNIFADAPMLTEADVAIDVDPVGEPLKITLNGEMTLSQQHQAANYTISTDSGGGQPEPGTPTGPGGGSGSGTGGGSGSGSSSGESLSDAGDPTSPLQVAGVGGVALGAIAAGVLLYEKRRAENENSAS